LYHTQRSGANNKSWMLLPKTDYRVNQIFTDFFGTAGTTVWLAPFPLFHT